MAVSPLQECDVEFRIIQHALPKPDLTVSELHGLNLNVTVPLVERKLPGLGRKLPVCVYPRRRLFNRVQFLATIFSSPDD